MTPVINGLKERIDKLNQLKVAIGFEVAEPKTQKQLSKTSKEAP